MAKPTADNHAGDRRAKIKAGNAHYVRHDWAAAYRCLAAAHARQPLDGDDLEALVWSAALVGDDDVMLGCLERIYQACVERGECQRAAHAAFWSGFRLFALNEPARAGGWLSRAERLLEQDGRECVMHGYLMLPKIVGLLGAGDYPNALAVARQAVALGERYDDTDLATFARHFEGRTLMRQGHVGEGLRLLDETMVAATSGELSPLMTGLVYCSVIACCQQMFAFDHAREWTAVLAAWCADELQLAAFTRTCQVHRAEVLQLGGDWPAAMEQAERACQVRVPEQNHEGVANALYQQAEIHRLRGRFEAAEAAYRESSRHGREPQPGLALLRLAQGRADDAAAAIARVLETTSQAWQRARFLPAEVEIALSTGTLERARAASEELAAIARQFDSEVLTAMADHAWGALRLAEGDARNAIEPLRSAFRVWHKVGAPYIVARVRVLVARACELLGDGEGAELERDAAREVFETLGAAPDLSALDDKASAAQLGGLSPREVKVLKHVAAGETNKEIAEELQLSVRTVDRHLSNIFSKLGATSRTEAAAYAFRNGLL
jgi:DNA-binding CsgD family transcriptional regulator